MSNRPVKEVVADCDRSLAEMRALLEGKPTAKMSEEQLREAVPFFEDLFGFKTVPKKPADNY
jgi:hypothetical protein